MRTRIIIILMLLATCVSGQDILSDSLLSSLSFFESQIKDDFDGPDYSSIKLSTIDYSDIAKPEEIFILDNQGIVISDGSDSNELEGSKLDFIPSQHYEFWNTSIVVYNGNDYIFKPVINDNTLAGYIVVYFRIDEEESYEELYLRLESLRIRKQIESYLLEHPDYSVQDLLDDRAFTEIAIENIGEKGYTSVASSNPFRILIHTDPDIVGKNRTFFKENASVLWDIIEPALSSRCVESSGSYKWPDGQKMIQKYIYFSCVDQITADNVTLSVAATASLDELRELLDIRPKRVSQGPLDIFVKEHDEMFSNQVLDVISLSKVPIIISTVSEANKKDRHILFEMWSSSETREYVHGRAVGDGDPGNDLNPDAASYLQDIQSLYSVYPEIFITDKRGFTVAATGVTGDFDQGPENWHMVHDELVNDGQVESWFNSGIESDEVTMGELDWDESAKSWGIDIISQIKKDDEVIGVLKAVLDYDTFIDRIITNVAENHEIYIINTDGYLVASSIGEYNHTKVSSQFKEILDMQDENSGSIEYDGEKISFRRSEVIEDHILIMVARLEEEKDNFASQSIKDKAVSVAKQIEIYLISNPHLTLNDLQEDPYFQEIAVQDVGLTGYTAVTEYDTLICRFHKNPDIVDKDLSEVASTLPGFWNIMSRTKGGLETEGVYDWLEPDGLTRQKYMYIAVVGPKTADGVGLHVAATTYLDEYDALEVVSKERIQYDFIYLLTGLFCLAIFMLFFFSKTDDGKIKGMKVHYKSLLVLGILALVFHIYYLTTTDTTLGMIAMRLVLTCLLFFSLQIAIINLKVSHIEPGKIAMLVAFLVTSFMSCIIMFTGLVVDGAEFSPNSFGNIVFNHGGLFTLYGLVVLLYFIIPFIIQLIFINRHDKKELRFFIFTYTCFLLIVIADVFLYTVFKTRNPVFILITPTLLATFMGIGLTVRKIITQQRNTVMFTLAVSLLMIIFLFVMNTLNVTNNLKDMEIENVNEQQKILVEHSIHDIGHELNKILGSVKSIDLDVEDDLISKMMLRELYEISEIVSNVYIIDSSGLVSKYPEDARLDRSMLPSKFDGNNVLTDIYDGNVFALAPLDSGRYAVFDISLKEIANHFLDWAQFGDFHIIVGNTSFDGGVMSSIDNQIMSDVRQGRGGTLITGVGKDKTLNVYNTMSVGSSSIGLLRKTTFDSVFARLSSSVSKIWIFTIGTIVVIMIIGAIFNSVLTHSLRKEVDTKTNKLTDMITELTDTKAAVMNMMEDITKANEELKELDQAKSNFLNMVSHELKTPLTAMNAHLEVLDDMSDNLERQQLRSFDAIRRNSNQLRILIENILEIARIESNKFHLNLIDLDLAGIINDVVDNLSIIAKNKQVNMTADVQALDRIIADEARIKEILNNLVSNAIKFTENGEIKITAKEDDKNILVSVRDSGIGIPEEKMGNLFQKFYQVDASLSRRYGGTGLGLSITKQLVELQGGKIWVESNEGKGSEFFFTLPLKRSKG